MSAFKHGSDAHRELFSETIAMQIGYCKYDKPFTYCDDSCKQFAKGRVEYRKEPDQGYHVVPPYCRLAMEEGD